jgi:hypothetical protein
VEVPAGGVTVKTACPLPVAFAPEVTAIQESGLPEVHPACAFVAVISSVRLPPVPLNCDGRLVKAKLEAGMQGPPDVADAEMFGGAFVTKLPASKLAVPAHELAKKACQIGSQLYPRLMAPEAHRLSR